MIIFESISEAKPQSCLTLFILMLTFNYISIDNIFRKCGVLFANIQYCGVGIPWMDPFPKILSLHYELKYAIGSKVYLEYVCKSSVSCWADQVHLSPLNSTDYSRLPPSATEIGRGFLAQPSFLSSNEHHLASQSFQELHRASSISVEINSAPKALPNSYELHCVL